MRLRRIDSAARFARGKSIWSRACSACAPRRTARQRRSLRSRQVDMESRTLRACAPRRTAARTQQLTSRRWLGHYRQPVMVLAQRETRDVSESEFAEIGELGPPARLVTRPPEPERSSG